MTLEELRALLGKADALAHATETLFESKAWLGVERDRRQLERLAYLLDATVCAIGSSVKAADEMSESEVARRG